MYTAKVRIRVETVPNWTLSKLESARTLSDLDRSLTQASDGVVGVLRRIQSDMVGGDRCKETVGARTHRC